MKTVEQFEIACEIARHGGYQIRHEYLGGQGGGVCEFGGKKWIFIDLALSTGEQLDSLCDALREQKILLSDESIPAWIERAQQQARRNSRRVA